MNIKEVFNEYIILPFRSKKTNHTSDKMSTSEVASSSSSAGVAAAESSSPDVDVMLNYFAEHKVESLLSDIVVALGQQRPTDPAAFISEMVKLKSMEKTSSSSSVK